MMVQRIDIPVGLVPTSQEAGGMVHDATLAHTAPGSPPGYDGGALTYPVTTDAPKPAILGEELPVSSQTGPGLPPRIPAGTEGGGRWTNMPQGPGSEGGWSKTPSAGQ